MNKNFYVCSYGGSGSWMLVKFLRHFGKAFHIHTRTPPNEPMHAIGEQFGNTPDPNAVIIYLYSRPEFSITRSWSFCNMHFKNIGCEKSVIEKIPNSPNDYVKMENDIIDYEGFFDNYVSHCRMPEIVCVNYHEIWNQKTAFFEAVGLPVERATRAFPMQRPVSEPISRQEVFEGLNQKIDQMPPIFIRRNP